jgi:hypothetical protein
MHVHIGASRGMVAEQPRSSSSDIPAHSRNRRRLPRSPGFTEVGVAATGRSTWSRMRSAGGLVCRRRTSFGPRAGRQRVSASALGRIPYARLSAGREDLLVAAFNENGIEGDDDPEAKLALRTGLG